jgi:hypothetical protein
MAVDIYEGDDVRVLLAINAAAAGITFDGVPGAYDCVKVNKVTIEDRTGKEPIKDAGIFPSGVIYGAEFHTITVEKYLSYSYDEFVFQLYNGGAISTVGAAAPYTHTLALVQKLLNGSFAIEYIKQSGLINEVIKQTYANFVITAAEIKESPEGAAMLSYSGFSTAKVRIINQAALTAAETLQPVSWRNLQVVLDGTATDVGEIGIALAKSVVEGDVQHSATTPATQKYNANTDKMSVGYTAEVIMSDATHILVAKTGEPWTGANTFTWNNDVAAGGNCQIIFTLGDSELDSPSGVYGALGVQKQALSLKAYHDAGGTAIIGIQFINARVTIP